MFPHIESETPRWRSWAGMMLVAILILVVGAASYQLLRGSEMPKSLAGLLSSLGITRPQVTVLQPAALGLEVLLEGDSLRVSWNQDLPSIATAKRGSLSILDGGDRRNVNLGTDQLRTGYVSLTHNTSQVTVSFQVIGANDETVESTPAVGVESATVARSGASGAESRDRVPTIKIDRSPPSSGRGSETRAQTESSRRNRNPEAAGPSQRSLARATPPPTSRATSARSTLPPPPVSSPGVVERKPAEVAAQRDEPQRPQTTAPEQVKPVTPPASAPLPSETTQRPPVEPPPKVTEPARPPDTARTAQEQPPPSTPPPANRRNRSRYPRKLPLRPRSRRLRLNPRQRRGATTRPRGLFGKSSPRLRPMFVT